jgi:putative transcriptional regulator
VKNELRIFRARHEMSQADLADKLGVSRQTVNAIETGRYDPSLALAFKVAALFGCSIEEVFHSNEVPRTINNGTGSPN